MLSVNLQDVEPHLQRPLKTSETTYAESLVIVLSSTLNTLYGASITPDNQVIFIHYMAKAIMRELNNPNPQVIKQSVEGASVEYSGNSTRGDMFLPAELSAMDKLTGRGRNRVIKSVSPKFLNR